MVTLRPDLPQADAMMMMSSVVSAMATVSFRTVLVAVAILSSSVVNAMAIMSSVVTTVSSKPVVVAVAILSSTVVNAMTIMSSVVTTVSSKPVVVAVAILSSTVVNAIKMMSSKTVVVAMAILSSSVVSAIKMMSSKTVVVAMAILSSTVVSAAETQNESYLIREVLLKHYDPAVRPVADPSLPLDVNISLGLKSFVELDMKKQTLTSFGWVKVLWSDAFLMWNVSQFPYEAVHLSNHLLWRPELIVFNTVKELDELLEADMRLTVHHDGTVKWDAGGLFKTFCSIDISNYPLDTQSCAIEVMSWSLDNRFLRFRLQDPAFEIDRLESHPEWKLMDTHAHLILRSSNFWVMRFTFVLKRRVMFYVINMMMPILLLSLMNCLVFLLPVKSGEKMTVSVTVFLSFAVFMSLINDSLPQNSDSLCLFSAYVAVQMFLSVCSIVMAAVIVFCSDMENEENEGKEGGEGGEGGKPPRAMALRDSGVSSAISTLHDVSNDFASVLASSVDSSPQPSCDTTPTASPYDPSTSTTRLNLTVKVKDEGFKDGEGCRSGCGQLGGGRGRGRTGRGRRKISKSLDKICFVLTVCLNVFSGVGFLVVMATSQT